MAYLPEILPPGAQRPVQETGLILPLPQVEIPTPPLEFLQPYPDIRFYPNGLIDLEPEKKDRSESKVRGNEYEEIAMIAVDRSLKDGQIAIGSHLLDAAISPSSLGQYGRPDVMVFGKDWTLEQMYEFKRSCNAYGDYERKLRRISDLLKQMRNSPQALGRELNRVTGQDLIPGSIKIPTNKKLPPLVFVSSDEWTGDSRIGAKGTSLKGIFQRVPIESESPAVEHQIYVAA